MRRGLWVVLLAVVVGACRDEQAGPKSRVRAAQPAQGPRALDAAPADLTWRGGATWAQGAVVYLGSKVEPVSAQPGQQVTLRHYFTATRQPPQGWGFFVHVADATSRQQVGNLDHEIQNGAAPLGTWPVGKVVEDVHTLQFPNYPGQLQLLLGFWQGNQRLPVDTPQLQDGTNRVLGPRIGPSLPELKEYRTPKTPTPPTIDGDLSDGVWQAAQPASLAGSFDGRPVTRPTTFRVLWDDENLYVAFDATDPDVWGSKRNKDDDIYNEDAVEFYVDADGDGATYNELQVSPHNVNFDASFVARRSDLPTAMQWESGMVSAVKVKGTLDDDRDQDERWTVELKIPLKNLNAVPHLPPQKGDRWRFNVYRLEHLVHLKNIEAQAFSPLFAGDFHHLPRFGWLVFD